MTKCNQIWHSEYLITNELYLICLIDCIKSVLVMQFYNGKEEDVWNKIPAVASRISFWCTVGEVNLVLPGSIGVVLWSLLVMVVAMVQLLPRLMMMTVWFIVVVVYFLVEWLSKCSKRRVTRSSLSCACSFVLFTQF